MSAMAEATAKPEHSPNARGHHSTDRDDMLVKGYPASVSCDDVNVLERYMCTECNLLLKQPVQSSCGHRFCKVCLARLSQDQQAICKRCVADPECDDLERDAHGQVLTFPDIAIMREMRRLPAKCHYEGCQWKGTFGDFVDHEASCKHRQVTCPECGAKVARHQLKKHIDPEKGDCPKVKCPFGCDNNNTECHHKDGVVTHSLVLLEKLKQLERTIQGHADADHQPDLLSHLTDLEGKEEGIQKVRRAQQGLEPASVQSSMTVTELVEKNAVLETLTAVLNNELETVINTMAAVEHQRKLDQCNMETMEKKVRALERSMALKDVELAETQIRIDALENTSYDGTYVWRITDFRRRRQDAINGRKLSIYSPPFNTGKAGYKVCARIYLNGDGMGKGTHISLFFVILKGLHDPILQWPFPHKVTFTLLDQTGHEHLVDGFLPDPNSSSFRRPMSDMNIASEMPQFCPLSRIDQPNSPYTKENTMFIRMHLDGAGSTGSDIPISSSDIHIAQFPQQVCLPVGMLSPLREDISNVASLRTASAFAFDELETETHQMDVEEGEQGELRAKVTALEQAVKVLQGGRQ